MFREIRLSRYLRHYIEQRHYLRPLIAGLVVGVTSGFAFGFYLFKAISPGLLGAMVLVFLSGVFALVSSAVTAFIFFYLQLYRMAKFVGKTCHVCGSELPKNAEFCPFCGSKVER